MTPVGFGTNHWQRLGSDSRMSERLATLRERRRVITRRRSSPVLSVIPIAPLPPGPAAEGKTCFQSMLGGAAVMRKE